MTTNKLNTKNPSILDTIEDKGYTQKLVQVQLGGELLEEEGLAHHQSDGIETNQTRSESSLELKYKAVGLIGLVAW